MADALVNITLPDGSSRQIPAGSTVGDVAASIGARLAKEAVAGKLNGRVVDLSVPIEADATVEIVTPKTDAGVDVIRHSTAHLLAHAVQELYPETKVTIGPVIENGFYYDFDRKEPFTEDDLRKIEDRMREIAKRDLKIERHVEPKERMLEKFKAEDETYKVELISNFEDPISYYSQGDWFDLCTGPHVPSTGRLGVFKLLSVAGAYWRGDERNPQLQRIYGTAWADKKDLEAYLHALEEAKKRDHRKLGKELDLFSFHPVAPASPFFHPKGATVYNLLVDYIRELYFKHGYHEVVTPQIADVDLWKKSGHYDNFAESMYFTDIEERDFAVKPMNCPGHCVIYSTHGHSYRDLPLRMADFGRLHRYERSGVTAGLTRVRTFSQDDAHIFCAPEQMQAEIFKFLDLIEETYRVFGFSEVRIAVATRPAKSMGTDEQWELAENALMNALRERGIAFAINTGEGAFYGPKIEFQVLDALKRPWQLGTIQVDYSMPTRFGLTYRTAEGNDATPVMLHRAMLGSIERFMGIYIEHCAGAFPGWLAPVQATVLTVSEKSSEYGERVAAQLRSAGIRVELDNGDEKIGAKIRKAQLMKVPYMLVIGEREAHEQTVAVRTRTGEQLPPAPVGAFVERVKELIHTRSVALT
jgi:threonyl-tRNA synthetase